MSAEKEKTKKIEIPEDISFEEAMEKLESIAAKLAGENVPLDEAVALYESGVSYYNVCRKKLDDANQRIQTIEEHITK